jgi:hypothetical protein
MTSLIIPSFERRLLQTVCDEVAAEPVSEWPPQALQLCLNLLVELRENAVNLRHALEGLLAEGVEARRFVRGGSPVLAFADDQCAKVRALVERLAQSEDTASASLTKELRLLERESQAFRDLLAEALSKASEPARPVDWHRVRAAEEAYARGETTPFSQR